MTLPVLLRKLTADQRLRILALDYVTASGTVPVREWCAVAGLVESYLKTGEVKAAPKDCLGHPKIVALD